MLLDTIKYCDCIEWESTCERRQADIEAGKPANPFDDPEIQRRMADIICRAVQADWYENRLKKPNGYNWPVGCG